jgi:hypothetical protein
MQIRTIVANAGVGLLVLLGGPSDAVLAAGKDKVATARDEQTLPPPEQANSLVRIPLRDAQGKVRAIMSYRANSGGKSVISFSLPDGTFLNEIGTGDPAPPAPAAAANPLVGEQIGPVPPTDMKADELDYLQRQITALRAKLTELIDRINAAARK